jgi:hypothetical protein
MNNSDHKAVDPSDNRRLTRWMSNRLTGKPVPFPSVDMFVKEEEKSMSKARSLSRLLRKVVNRNAKHV